LASNSARKAALMGSNAASPIFVQAACCSHPVTALPAQSKAELANLDLLRTVAVMLVFIGHLLGTMKIRGGGDLGHFGVLLFFVHTSLVLMMSMERLGLSGRDLYAAFVIRRLFRIYPLSILSVAVVVSLRIPSTSWAAAYAWPGWHAVVSNLLLTQNITQSPSVNCVLWSLPFEIQMYAILPMLFLWTVRFPSLRATFAIWLLSVALAAAEYMVRLGSVDSAFLAMRYFPCFAAGVFAWRFLKTREPRFPGWAWVLVLAALVITYRIVDALRVYGPGVFMTSHGSLRNDHHLWWPPYLDLVNGWAFCAATGLAIPFFCEIRSRWLQTLSKQVARYSYGIYVSHVPILWLCFVKFHIGSVAGTLMAFLLTAGVSVFVYRCLEDPAIRLGKRIAIAVAQRPGLA